MRLMVEIRLRRGLSLILGDVGTGKTTLSRKLFHMLKEREDIIFHMLLDPTYDTEQIFLDSLIRTFNLQQPGTAFSSILDYKEALKKYLFQKGVEENKIVVLLIDEAQKLNPLTLEILRVLLNYETNEYKLLQVVLLAQIELLPKLRDMRNFCDRINLKYVLNPLDQQETKELIEFRIKQAGYFGPNFFTDDAIIEIHRHTQGYPRRIAMLCHQALKTLVMDNKPFVDAQLISELIARDVKINV
jgi:general secretion pathway protein A